uniref:FYVE and coiled-coil domain-containing protein 1 n=1 Tax=Myripristis murdjan TaxID=586833 RepID=A0A667XZT7_9TELE
IIVLITNMIWYHNEAVSELAKEYRESGEPITDDSTNLHKFSYKLEYLLQFDQKEKTTFLGTRKDYWDYFSDCLAKIKGANDGIRFVKSISELKTSLGKGRAFIRYSLVHQRLADTLQQCLMNQRVTSDWYYARSPFLKPHLSVDIISHLYELNEVQFDVASRGHDLDASWPTFQAPEFPSSPDYGQGLLSDLNESLPTCSEDVSAVEDLRLELDQSELKQRELLDRVQQLGNEAAELRGVVVELQRQLDAASYFDSAQKIHELLDRLKEAEKGKMEAVAEVEEKKRQAERLEEELRVKEAAAKESETKLGALVTSASEEKAKLEERLEEQCNALDKLQGGLTLKEKEASNLQRQLQDIQRSLEEKEKQVEEFKRKAQEDKDEMQRNIGGLKESLEAEVTELKEQLRGKDTELTSICQTLQQMIEDYKTQCTNLMELNGKLLTTVKRNEELKKEMAENRTVLEAELAALRASEKQLRGQLDDAKVTVDEKEKRLRDENRTLDESLQRAVMAGKLSEATSKRLEQENQSLREEQNEAKMIERVTSEKQAVEKSQVERSSLQAKENQEMTAKLTMLEGQLEVNMKEVSRLQAEVLDLRVQLQRSGEEKLKSQAQLEVTEAQRDEFRTLTEQLKTQIETLNQRHIAELMESKHKEEALIAERDREAAVRSELAASEAVTRQELATLKAENERLAMENSETREGIHRANTEMAELGMTICKLTAENEETTERWAADAARIEDLEKHTTKEVERLEACVTALQQENASLREELTQMENLPGTLLELQEKLEKAQSQVKSLKDSSREEMEGIKFQMSSESMNYQNQIKVLNEQHSQRIDEKDAHITKSDNIIRQNEREIQQLRDTEEALSAVQTVRDELKEKLEKAEADKQTSHLKMSAEIDDLIRTKSNLEERLIELIKDKDALWQKSDALEFEQKLRMEERWWLVDQEATHCLGCQGQFTWWLRKHHCRLCGRIFCYYCSNNFVMTKHSGKKERCCRECYTQHSAVVERFTEAELSPADTQPPPPGFGPQSPPANRSDDSAFDIITEEEVNGIYDSDTMSQTTGGPLQSYMDSRSLSCDSICRGTGDATPDDSEEHVPTVQDSEINLLRSGEVTMAVPLSIDDISQFGDGSRELFIKSSCYSVIAIAVGDCGPTVSWMFSSEPKSISFSVVYRETSDSPVEQSKVLIPLTRCNSHKETIQGQLKVRNPGLYTLIFDNSFSRFISKKVLYHLTIEKPVIYDGSDFP